MNTFFRWLGLAAAAHTMVWAQPATGARGARGGRGAAPPQNTPAESRVFVRGDVELLTFETEADLAELERRYEAGRNAPPKPGELTMHYLRSRTDGSVQPYAVWLPRDYAPGKKFPLVVQLHGIGGKTVARFRLDWPGMRASEWIDPHAPVIYLHSLGRSNTFYQGMGEVDVLEGVDDVMRRYAVDAERVFIMGHSMGGAGSWFVGLLHPDRFGSVTPIDAAMGFNDAVEDSSGLPAWMQPQIAMFKPNNLFPNARNIPVYMKNAGDGIQKNTTRFSDGVIAEGGFATSESFPGMPHHFAPQFPYGAFTSSAVALPIKRRPVEVKFFTTTLGYNQAYWVTLDRITKHNAESRISATYDDGQPPPLGPGAAATRARALAAGQPVAERPTHPASFKVATTNVEAFTLDLVPSGFPRDGSVLFSVDGTAIPAAGLAAVTHFSRASGAWRTMKAADVRPGAKRHGVQGPIGDAFNSKFLAVYSEGDRELAMAELDAIRNPPSRLAINGEFPMKAAAKVTAADVASSNLILFGTAASNAVLKRLAPRLPAKWIAAATNGADGVVFIHPNPENPERYVVVWSTRVLSVPDHGINSGWMMPINLLPDFALVKAGKIAEAGHFDSDWK